MLTARDARRRPRRGPRRRRRRLPGQAVRARGAARARCARCCAARRDGADGERAALRRPRARPRRARRSRRGERADRAHPHRVPLLELFLRNPRQVLTRSADLRARLGLRLRARLELARGLRRLPAPQARGGGRAAADPHGARRRLRAARADERSARRLALLACARRRRGRRRRSRSVLAYVVVRGTLRGAGRRSRCATARPIAQDGRATASPSRRALRRRAGEAALLGRRRAAGTFTQIVAGDDGARTRCPAARSALPVDRSDAASVAAGHGAAVLQRPRRSTACTCASTRARLGGRRCDPGRAAADRGRQRVSARCARRSALLIARRRRRSPLLLGRLVSRAALRPVARPHRRRPSTSPRRAT